MRIRGAVLDGIGLPRPYSASKPLTIDDLDLAPPGDNELLVRVEAAGLCHSDLSVVDGNQFRPVPMLLGHEAAGTVDLVGAGAGVGMAAMLTALAHDDVRVVAVDQLPDKLHRARSMGAHEAYTPTQAADRGVKLPVVIEAAGHPSALQTAIGLTGPGGRTITVGLPPPDARISVPPLGFVAEGRALIGSYLGSAVPARDIPRFVSLWRSGRLPIESLVSLAIRLDQINDGMDQLADGKAVRQIISFG